MRSLPATLLLAMLAAVPLGAQGATTPDSARLAGVALPHGHLVRVTLAPTARVDGRADRLARIDWMRSDSLRVTWVRTVGTRTLPWSQVERIDTAAGREGSGHNTRVGMVAGGVVGVEAGVLYGTLGAYLCEGPDCPTQASLAILPLVGGGVGMLLGHVVGSAIPGRQRWATVVGTPAVGRAPRRGRTHELAGMLIGAAAGTALVWGSYEAFDVRIDPLAAAAGGIALGLVPGSIVGAAWR